MQYVKKFMFIKKFINNHHVNFAKWCIKLSHHKEFNSKLYVVMCISNLFMADSNTGQSIIVYNRSKKPWI